MDFSLSLAMANRSSLDLTWNIKPFSSRTGWVPFALPLSIHCGCVCVGLDWAYGLQSWPVCYVPPCCLCALFSSSARFVPSDCLMLYVGIAYHTLCHICHVLSSSCKTVFICRHVVGWSSLCPLVSKLETRVRFSNGRKHTNKNKTLTLIVI